MKLVEPGKDHQRSDKNDQTKKYHHGPNEKGKLKAGPAFPFWIQENKIVFVHRSRLNAKGKKRNATEG